MYGGRLVAQQDVTIKPLTQLILAYYHLEQYTECIEVCDSFSERAEMYYYALADNAEETGNYTSAITNYDTAYYLFKAPIVKYNLGRIYQTKFEERGGGR